MTDVLRLAMGPVLLWQGRQMYRRIPRLPEPTGDRVGTVGAGPELRLLVVGDSSGAGVGVATQDEALLGRTLARLADQYQVHYRLEAKHGSTIERTRKHLQKLPPERFEHALLAIGLNDVLEGRPITPWLESYAALAEDLGDRFGVRKLVASALPPVGEFPAIPNPLRWYMARTARRHDAALCKWARTQPDVAYIDFEPIPGGPLHDVPFAEVMASDGFHPGPRIYDEWGRRAAKALMESDGKRSSPEVDRPKSAASATK